MGLVGRKALSAETLKFERRETSFECFLSFTLSLPLSLPLCLSISLFLCKHKLNVVVLGFFVFFFLVLWCDVTSRLIGRADAEREEREKNKIQIARFKPSSKAKLSPAAGVRVCMTQ